jgi:hypothetical protein
MPRGCSVAPLFVASRPGTNFDLSGSTGPLHPSAKAPFRVARRMPLAVPVARGGGKTRKGRAGGGPKPRAGCAFISANHGVTRPLCGRFASVDSNISTASARRASAGGRRKTARSRGWRLVSSVSICVLQVVVLQVRSTHNTLWASTRCLAGQGRELARPYPQARCTLRCD